MTANLKIWCCDQQGFYVEWGTGFQRSHLAPSLTSPHTCGGLILHWWSLCITVRSYLGEYILYMCYHSTNFLQSKEVLMSWHGRYVVADIFLSSSAPSSPIFYLSLNFRPGLVWLSAFAHFVSRKMTCSMEFCYTEESKWLDCVVEDKMLAQASNYTS